MKNLPLIANKSLTSTLALVNGQKISCQQLLEDVAAVAANLPHAKYVINLCNNPYDFIKGFAAALLRQQITLFPHHVNPHVLEQLQSQYPDCYLLVDEQSHKQDKGVYHIQTASAENTTATDSIPLIDSDQYACVFFTSGSTGTPKAYIKTWGELTNRALQMGDILGLNNETINLLSTVPNQHLFGFEHYIMMALQSKALLNTTKIFFPQDLKEILSCLDHAIALVSTPYHLQCFIRENSQYPSLQSIFSSTAPMDQSLAKELEASFNTQLIEIYGCTELGAIATRRTVEDQRWHLIEGFDIHQQDHESKITNRNTQAEIALPDHIIKHNNQSFTLQGRKQDNINIAGKRMSLADLNLQLNQIQGIQDAVIYIPDYLQKVSRTVAFVVTETLSEHDIKKQLRQRIDPLFIPKYIIKVASLPRNAVGKITKTELDYLVLVHLKPKFEFIIDANHPSLPGHFPNYPIVPGAVILDYIMASYTKINSDFKIKTLIHAKFRQKLTAQNKVTVEFSHHRQGIQFKAFTNDVLLTSGVFK